MAVITLNYDSHTIMSHVYSEMYNEISRHISMRHVYVHELVLSGVITIIFVKSGDNFVDLLTKPLTRELLRSITNGMGLKLLNLSTNDSNPTLD